MEEMLKEIRVALLEADVNFKVVKEFVNQVKDKGLLEKLHNVVNSDFARISYTDAIKELEKNKRWN